MWASENPKIWENENGISVYSWNKAWGKKQDETLTVPFAGSFSHFIAPILGIDVHYFYFQKQSSCQTLYADE
jgi:hypothetical protein